MAEISFLLVCIQTSGIKKHGISMWWHCFPFFAIPDGVIVDFDKSLQSKYVLLRREPETQITKENYCHCIKIIWFFYRIGDKSRKQKEIPDTPECWMLKPHTKELPFIKTLIKDLINLTQFGNIRRYSHFQQFNSDILNKSEQSSKNRHELAWNYWKFWE